MRWSASAPSPSARASASGPPRLSHQLQDLDRGVIVVQHVALGRLPDQLVEGRSEVGRDCRHDVPLGRGRQRNPQIPLQAFEAVERQSAAVFQKPDHGAGRGIVLLAARFFRRGGGEYFAAQVATQFLQPVNLRRHRRLPADPHHHARSLVVDGALTAGGTGVAGRERRMRHVNPRGATVSVGAVAPVTLADSRRIRFVGLVCVRFAIRQFGVCPDAMLRTRVWLLCSAPHDRLGLLCACPKEQLAQPANRGVLVFHQIGHIDVRLEDRPNQLGVLLVQRLLDAAQDLLQLRAVHFDNLRRVSHPATTRCQGRASPAASVRPASNPGMKTNGARFARSGKSRWRPGQVRGPTGRQSAAAPVRVGLPAESNTDSWWAASR